VNEYIESVKGEGYELGVFDCCTFAAGAVEAMIGVDPMAEFRGTYSTIAEYRQALKTIGKGTLYKTLVSKFGKPVNGCRGVKGDVAWHDRNCGVVLGYYAMFIAERGFVYVPVTKLQRVFQLSKYRG
jgi:hypothetical protein